MAYLRTIYEQQYEEEIYDKNNVDLSNWIKSIKINSN